MNVSLDQIYHMYMYSYPHKTAYRELKGIAIKDYYHFLKESSDNSLYIHIPFCESKCGYCNLFSIAGQDEEYIGNYLTALVDQVKQSGLEDIMFQDFILGGGTPLLLKTKWLEQLFQVAEQVGVDHKKTYSIVETSPKQATDEKLHLCKEFHVNRISIGIQSFIEDELQILKRQQNSLDVEMALERIKKAQFECVNVDLIYGIPDQTIDSLKYSIDRAMTYQPEEFFIYPLYIREHTSIRTLERNPKTYDMYLFARDYLLSLGYSQMSMRRFTKQPQEYSSCGFGQTISFGCGGRSYLSNLHVCSKYSTNFNECKAEISRFIKEWDKDIGYYGIFLDLEEQKRRYVIKHLFQVYGVEYAEYQRVFKEELYVSFPFMKKWEKNGYLVIVNEQEQTWVRLTALGMSLSDYLGPMFISEKIRKQMKGVL